MSEIHPSPGGTENTYLLNPENTTEMTRLIDQEQVLRHSTGGPFVGRADLSGIFDVLDVGCGPGGWAQAVAHAYPEMEVTGIDISQTMIHYAQAQAQVRELPNLHFSVMNALKPLDFPAESFDLVHAQAIVGFVPTADWPKLVAECYRVLRPGGLINLVEGEWGFTNMPALETFLGLSNQVMHMLGRGGSPTGRHIGITPLLPRFLERGGFEQIELHARPIDYSFGTEAHPFICHDYMLAFQMGESLFLKTQLLTKEKFARLYQQTMEEIQSEEFRGLWYHLSVWGRKPL